MPLLVQIVDRDLVTRTELLPAHRLLSVRCPGCVATRRRRVKFTLLLVLKLSHLSRWAWAVVETPIGLACYGRSFLTLEE